ncbi:transposase IS4 family protein [Actinoplanes sp. N902-109]|nr:transposase IS4 family protein [Actinoplanes sp. N902-109]
MHPFRDIVDAILWIDRSGCSWRQLPVDFAPWQTVYGWFKRWKERGVTERILAGLREQVRLAEGCDTEPSAGVIDSQLVRAADTVGRDTRGFDAGKRVNGRKRFIVIETLGLLVSVRVLAASWQPRRGQDRDALRPGP